MANYSIAEKIIRRVGRGRTKAVSVVFSYMLVFIMTLSLIGAAYTYVVPQLADMKSKSEFEYMITYMKNLDDKIKLVSRGGEGSKDYISVNIEQGTLNVYDVDDKVEYLITSNICLEAEEVPGLYFEKDVKNTCLNKIILNYTGVDIVNNVTARGFLQLYIENLGFQNNKPLLSIG